MDGARTNFLRGVLDLLVLRLLAGGPRHATGLTEELQGVFEGVDAVRVGSLHGSLRRLEERGWATSEYGRSEANRLVRLYSLTPVGWTRLESSADDWNRFSALVSGLLLRGRGRSGAADHGGGDELP